MAQLTVTLPDGSKREYETGTTLEQVAESIGKRLAKEALGAKINGKVVDLSTGLKEDAYIEILTFDSPDGKEIFRHSASHIMAQAVKRLFPNTKYAIGPAIKDGFYYDFEVETPLSPEDLEKIESEMTR
ncbi:MAG TPA: TGS domain-containing protein, partial [Spirochaetes bacterium]|nr:TGS domain-containing protein [Spirochaetota bacterium]